MYIIYNIIGVFGIYNELILHLCLCMFSSTIKLPNTSADKVKGVRAITFTGLPSHMTEDGCGSVVGSHDSSSHTTYHQTDTSQPVPNCSCSSVMVLQSHFASHISVPSDPITTSGNPSTTCHKSPLSFPEFPTSQSTDTSTAISHVFQPIDTSTEVSHISQPTDTPREICHTSQLIGKSTEISHSSQPTDRCREICHISQSALLSTSYLVMTCSSPTVPHHVKCSQTTVSPDMKPCTLVTSCVASCTEPLQTLSYGNSSVDVKDIQIHGSQDALWYSASGSVRRRTEALSLYTLTEACCHDNQAVQPGSTVSPERLPLCATGSLACDLGKCVSDLSSMLTSSHDLNLFHAAIFAFIFCICFLFYIYFLGHFGDHHSQSSFFLKRSMTCISL